MNWSSFTHLFFLLAVAAASNAIQLALSTVDDTLSPRILPLPPLAIPEPPAVSPQLNNPTQNTGDTRRPRRRHLSTNWCQSKFTWGNHTLPRFSTCNLTAPITVGATTSLTLSSAPSNVDNNPTSNAIISGLGTTRLFAVYGNLVITDLVLEQGLSNAGSAMFISVTAPNPPGSVHLIRTLVQNCVANSHYGGGAYLANGATLILDGSTFQSNTAAMYGGAIMAHLGSQIVLATGTMSVVKDNKASRGGGLYCESPRSSLNISGANTQLVVSGNSATDQVSGGGIFVRGSASLTIDSGGNLSVSGNKANGLGGGIYVGPASLTIDSGGKLFVSGNNATAAGGLFLNSAMFTMRDLGSQLLLSGNRASSYGGNAIFKGTNTDLEHTLSDGALMIVKDGYAGPGAGSFAGGIAIQSLNMILNRATILIQRNKAHTAGGGLTVVYGAMLRVSNESSVSVAYNTVNALGAGMAILSASVLTVNSGSTFSVYNNTISLTSSGGGILVEASKVTVSGQTTEMRLSGNVAGDGKAYIPGLGGGNFCMKLKSVMVVDDGARLIIQDGRAPTCGGFMVDGESNVTWTGGSRISVQRNVATGVGTFGGGVHISRGSVIYIENKTTGLIAGNTAFSGGGMVIGTGESSGTSSGDNSSLVVRGVDTTVIVANNSASSIAGGIFVWSSFSIQAGASIDVHNNKASENCQGVYAQSSNALLTVSGVGTRMIVSHHRATALDKNVGGLGIVGGTLIIKDGGYLKSYKNMGQRGGGMYLSGAIVQIEGARTRVVVQQNTAFVSAGGILLFRGSQLRIRSGARLEVLNNTANSFGGGMSIYEKGAYLFTDGSDTSLVVSHNKARMGGGIAVLAGGVIRSTAPSFFMSNSATQKSSGGMGYVAVGKNFGQSNCVEIVLYIKSQTSSAVSIHTDPPSALHSDDKEEIANQESEWCLPCGDYTVHVGSFIVGQNFGPEGLVTLRLKNNPTPFMSIVDVRTTTSVSKAIWLGCLDQGVHMSQAHFEDNFAQTNGGALGSSQNYNNGFFHIRDSTFVNNRALANGGAIHLSGLNVGLKIHRSTFRGNHAGNGGAFAVLNAAGLRVYDCFGIDNAAMSREGGGGFLYVRKSTRVSFKSTVIDRCTAEGGGGGIAVYGSMVALVDSNVSNCHAGMLGGGGLLLDEGAEAHVFSSMFENNTALKESGGHVRVAASTLIVHSLNDILNWPNTIPIFPDRSGPFLMVADKITSFSGGIASIQGGTLFCMASTSTAVFRRLASSTSACSASVYNKYIHVGLFNLYFPISSWCTGKGIFLGTGTVVKNSEATTLGGAISATLCDIELSPTTVTNNTADSGGAIYLGLDARLRVQDNTTFEKNTAITSGGAVVCDQCNSVSFAGFTRFVFNKAETEDGGAVYINLPRNQIKSNGTIFWNNVAHTSGGAVFLRESRWVSAGDSFQSNAVVAGSGGAIGMFGFGSRIYLTSNTLCRSNRALAGGGGCVMWNSVIDGATSVDLNPLGIDSSTASNFAFNKAAYGNDLATPGFSLRSINSTLQIFTADGVGFLFPKPRVELLDYYGHVVHGDYADVSVRALMNVSSSSGANAAQVFGATTVKTNKQGVALFTELGLQGAPSSGPHYVHFESRTALGRLLKTKRLITTFVGPCPEGKFLNTNSNQCGSCPANSDQHSKVIKGSPADACVCRQAYYSNVQNHVFSCNKCPSRSVSPQGSTSAKQCICDAGTYFDQLINTCQACPLNSVLNKRLVHLGNSETVCACNANFYRELAQDGKMSCQRCPGRSSSAVGSTQKENCKCEAGGYVADEDSGGGCVFCDDNEYVDIIGGKCVTCPEGAACKGPINVTGVTNLFGWAVCPDEKLAFTKCVFPAACLGKPNHVLKEIYYTGKTDLALLDNASRCNLGRIQNMSQNQRCSSCAPGYQPSEIVGVCKKCDQYGGTFALMVIVVVCSFLILLGFILLKMRSSGKSKASHSTMKRTLLSHLQMLSIVLTLKIQWYVQYFAVWLVLATNTRFLFFFLLVVHLAL